MLLDGSGNWRTRLAASLMLLFAACSMPDYRIAEGAGDGPDAVHCSNALFDGELGETDYDCGGGCPPCAIGRRCERAVDCADGACNQGTCVAGGCTNGVQDGSETAADCGGAACLKCPSGSACTQNGDCDSLRCDALLCLAASCEDGLQNGRETAIDCGGGCSPCATGTPCFSSSDCASGVCTQGVCVIAAQPGCDEGRADCNDHAADGCEVDLRNDPSSCGVCGSGCASLNASTTSCVEGRCAPVCAEGFGACASPELGCATPLGTTDNCTRCGESCGKQTPFCVSSGCSGSRDIAVADSGTRDMQAWNGTEGSARIDLEHTLQYAKGSARLVLVGVAAAGTGAGPFTVSYDDQPMLRAVELEHESRMSYAAIYYLLDDALPAAGATSQVRVTYNSSSWWGFGGFDVLEAQNVMQQAPLLTKSAGAASCDGTATRGVNLGFDSPGSLVYGVLSTRGTAADPAPQQTPTVTSSWSQSVDNGGDPHSGAASWVIDDDTRSLEWSVVGCDNSAAVGVVFERLHVP